MGYNFRENNHETQSEYFGHENKPHIPNRPKHKYLSGDEIRQSFPPSLFEDAEKIEFVVNSNEVYCEITHSNGDKMKIGMF